MLLKEMWSPLGGMKEEEQDINWMEDLKFYIDNEDDMLIKHIFPAVRKHEKHTGHPDAYKFYVKPIEQCCEAYCERFDIEDKHNKFPKEKLIELAQKICNEQEQHIGNGHYR